MLTFKQFLNKDDDYLYEMTNLHDNRHGIQDVVIALHNKKNAKHGPNIKVSNKYKKYARDDNFTVTTKGKIVGTPKIHPKHVQQIQKWVSINKEHIEKVCNDDGTMTIDEILNGLKSVD